MKRILIPVLIALICSGCRNPDPVQPPPPAFVVLSFHPDPSSGSISFNVRLTQPASPERAREAGESVIRSAMSQARSITVRTYVEGHDPSGAPYCVSILSAGEITHKLDPRAVTQKVPSH